ncbi:hypothetical protein M2145_000291 [Lachnospiraceae bacterium PF1-21]|uniref:hypothetical protein n=1 Tax=Ohessyouella blattaphilus TaxID=2949333 RepID=UPI003E3024D3
MKYLKSIFLCTLGWLLISLSVYADEVTPESENSAVSKIETIVESNVAARFKIKVSVQETEETEKSEELIIETKETKNGEVTFYQGKQEVAIESLIPNYTGVIKVTQETWVNDDKKSSLNGWLLEQTVREIECENGQIASEDGVITFRNAQLGGNVKLEKSSSSGHVLVNESVTESIKVLNKGQVDLSALKVSDKALVNYDLEAPGQGLNLFKKVGEAETEEVLLPWVDYEFDPEAGTITLLKSLLVKESIRIDFTFTPEEAKVYEGDVTLEGEQVGTPDAKVYDAVTHSVSVSTPLHPEVTLSAEHSSKEDAAIGSTVIYKLTVTNTGSDELKEIRISDKYLKTYIGQSYHFEEDSLKVKKGKEELSLAKDYTFANDNTGGEITLLGSLPVAEKLVVTFAIRMEGLGEYENEARVRALGSERGTEVATDAAVGLLVKEPTVSKVKLTQTTDKKEVSLGTPVNYTLKIENAGNGVLEGIRIENELFTRGATGLQVLKNKKVLAPGEDYRLNGEELQITTQLNPDKDTLTIVYTYTLALITDSLESESFVYAGTFGSEETVTASSRNIVAVTIGEEGLIVPREALPSVKGKKGYPEIHPVIPGDEVTPLAVN